ncbi:MAG: cyclic nucleotide-binding domain-containing protein [bacterium]
MQFDVVLGATAMAVLAMSALVIGALIGVFSHPSQRVNAIVMAFGTGALIQAVALELAYDNAEQLIHKAHLTGIESWFWVTIGFITGGVVYYLANRMLERRGAALRHPALTKAFLINKKRSESVAILERLSKIELVRSLPPEEMEDVLSCIQPVKVRSGEAIFRQGDKADALYCIDEGHVDILTDQSRENEAPFARLGPGQSFGEIALLSGEPRSATAIAVEETSLLKIEKELFDELMDHSPRLRVAVEQLSTQRLLKNVEVSKGRLDAGLWQHIAVANIQRISKSDELSMIKKNVESVAPLAIFLGAMLDGIPESIVIGSSYTSLESFKFTFLIAVFLANLPEAMSSAVGMQHAGFSTKRIFTLWGVLMLFGAVAAAVGNLYLSAAPPTLIALVEAIAGGGILAMVSSVMMPEAYEDGGPSVGLATIAGFLCAFLFTFL